MDRNAFSSIFGDVFRVGTVVFFVIVLGFINGRMG